MKTLFVRVESDNDGFTVYTENDIFSGLGDTLLEAKNDLIDQINLYVDVMKDEGKKYPEYLDGNFKIMFKFDVASFLKHYEGILGFASLERLTGIPRKQLWTYSNGRKPHDAQRIKIENAIHSFGEELVHISLLNTIS